MQKILVTGSSGFIGKNLTEYMQNEGYSISAPSHTKLDLTDEDSVSEYLKAEQFDVVIHAANTNMMNAEPYDILNTNLRMFYNLEKYQNEFGKMLYFGSGAEYSQQSMPAMVREEQFGTVIPKDAYGFTKYMMNKAAAQSSNIYDLCIFGVYGKYEQWQRRFISNAICRALKGMDITIQKNVYFDYLWIEDLCDITKWFIKNEPKYHHYNVCRGSKIDLYSLACMVKNILQIDCNIIIKEPGWKPDYTGDNGRLLQEIGDYKFTGYEESIEQLCEYYKKKLHTIDATQLEG